MATPATADAVLEHLFTHPNPHSGSPPPPHTAWVVFAQGTVFYSLPDAALPVDSGRDTLVAAALAALDALGPVCAGTPSADFHPGHLAAWFPDATVYLVNYASPAVASVFFGDGQSPLEAGLAARACRQRDFEARDIVAVRDFHGRRL
jgi:hypothetical protein